jgi:hypothetical protein
MSLLNIEVRLEALRHEIIYYNKQEDTKENRAILARLVKNYYDVKDSFNKRQDKPTAAFYRAHWEKAESMIEQLEDEIIILRKQIAGLHKLLEESHG